MTKSAESVIDFADFIIVENRRYMPLECGKIFHKFC